MNHPPSRLLQRLDAEIARLGECVESDCLRAEKACYFARQGRFGEASELAREVRARYERRPNYSVSAWLSLVDGLVSYFGDIGLGARDKFLRAQAYSSSAGLRAMDALASAWLAQLEYSSLDVEGLDRSIRRAFLNAAPTNHPAVARGSLVMAEALHFALRFDLALPWYERCRSHALADGDDATLSALIHNMAWLRMGAHRQSVHTGETVSGDAALALLGEASMRSFDELVGATSFKELDPLLRAQTLVLQDRVEEAGRLYEKHLREATMSGVSRWQSVFLADVAWCRVCGGDVTGSLEAVHSAESALLGDVQIDDRASTHSRLAAVLTQLGRSAEALSHEEAAQAAWLQVVALQARIVLILGDVGL